MTDTVLRMNGVSIRYDANGPAVLQDVSLCVRRGERVALVGLNGSGKTSLLLAIVGLVHHDGNVEVRGEPVSPSRLKQVRGNVGYVFNVPEDQLLLPTVIDDVAFGLVQRGVDKVRARQHAQTWLDRLGIGHLADAAVYRLSHGQKQRVALAGALVTEPCLVLLDEPSAALDPPSRRALATVLTSLDAAMVIATHDMDFAERVCTKFVLLDGGGIAHVTTDASVLRERL